MSTKFSGYDYRIIAKDVTMSNDTRATGRNNNDLILGSSGHGKTGGYVIPNLQVIDSSLIVADTKGQLERAFKNDLIKRGFDVHTINFVNPEKSEGYNLLDYIRRDEDGNVREQDVLTVSRLLVPTLDQDEPIWEQSAAGIIAMAISYVLEAMPKSKHNMIEVADFCRRVTADFGDEEILSWMTDHEDSFAFKKYFELLVNAKAEKMLASIAGFVSTALEIFNYKENEHIFANKASFDIGSLGHKKTVLFLNVSDTDASYDRIINVFYEQAMQVLCRQADVNPGGRLRVPVRIFMDDFAASAKLPNFDRMISVIRSRDIYVSIILQGITQLEAMYGKSAAMTILNNCDTIIYLGGQDPSTIEFVARRARKLPDTISEKPWNKVYVMISGQKTRLADKLLPYSTTKFYEPVEHEGA